jgi:hypothetical protein
MGKNLPLSQYSKRYIVDKRFESLSEMVNRVTSEHMPEGYPVRETCIGQDDILNLVIALNTTNCVYEFLVMI